MTMKPGLRSWIGGLAASVIASFATSALAQEPSVEEPTALDEIVVVGSRLAERVESFVEGIIEPPGNRGPARWSRHGGVCVGVANLRFEAAQAISDRVSEIAAGIGLSVGQPGCSPNLLIIATDDAPGMAAALVARSPNAFRPQYAGSSKSERDLDRFVTSEQPVRWWHVSMPVIAGLGRPAVRLPGENPDDPVFVSGDGRFRTGVRNVLLRAYVIIDLDQVESLDLRQLSDYSAMVAFSQIDPDAQTAGYSTILNVLADPSATPHLTDWDHAYLGGVYGGDRNQRDPRAQSADIASGMLRLAKANAEGTDPE